MQYGFIDQNGQRSISVFANGEVFVATDAHPRFDSILAGAKANDESVLSMFDMGREAAQRFERVSANGRVTVANGHVFFDGDEVDNSLTQQIMRFMDEGVEDFTPLVNFFEKVADNPQEHSRTQLFDWLSRHDFTISTTGDIVAYKGVAKQADGSLVSISRGPAIVDGVAVNGAVPNEVGSIVEMARSEVHHNPAVGCSTGLHAGTYNYAKDFSRGAVLQVHINPRDIVSVPTDCNWQKIRTCRYRVVKVIDVPVSSGYYADESAENGSQVYYECNSCLNSDFYENDLNEDGYCAECVSDIEAEMDREDEQDRIIADALSKQPRTATAWDTRLNYTKQKRYPKGHAKAGQFIPK